MTTVVTGRARCDSVRGHGRGSHVGVEATTRSPPPANVTRGPGDPGRWSGPVGSRGVRGRSAGSARNRRTGGPSTAGSGTGRAGSRPRMADATAWLAAPGSHRANAPRGTTAVVRWPRIGATSAGVTDRDRPDPSGLAGVAVPERVAVGAEVQPAAPALLAQEPMVDRMGGAEELAVERRRWSLDESLPVPAPSGRPADRRSRTGPAGCRTAGPRTPPAGPAGR